VNVRTGTLLPYLIVALLAAIVSGGAVAATPVPESKTVSVGFTGSLVVMLRLADSCPAGLRVGVNATLIVQFAPAATVPAHVLAVTAKSVKFVPRKAVVYVNDALPVLDSVTN
jgi:hypothetical protein